MTSPLLLLTLSLRSLRRNGTRSALAMLGVAVGIASVIVLSSVGEGAARVVERQVRSMGSNLVLVVPAPRSVAGVSLGAGTRSGLTPDDVDAIRREVPGIKAVSPVVEADGHVAYAGRNWQPLAIKGEGEEYLDVKVWDVAEGAYFSRDDVEAARAVCVLGETVREALFGDEDAAGAVIRIGQAPFRVAGVLGRRGPGAHGADQDDVVIVPWTTARRVLRGSRFAALDALLLSGVDPGTMDDVAREVAALLADRHPVADGAEPEFRVLSATELAERAAASTRVLTAFLTGVAAISLAVGGVGITNHMLVSVAQRTPEIGLRIALGARSRDILAHFLGEGILTALLAGIAGIVVGAALARGIAVALDWPAPLSPGAVAGAAAASSAVGLLSAAYPSFRASRLDPIAALRSG